MAKYLMSFIGTGNMGGTIAQVAASGTDPRRVLLADRATQKAAELAAALGCDAADNETAARESQYIFLGVKPHLMAGMLASIAPVLAARSDRFVLVSMAAALTIQNIRDMAGGEYPVVRINPNTPMAVGRGLVMYCEKDVRAEELSELWGTLQSGGVFRPLDESLIDAGSALSGCGPAFTYLFIEALADGGVECGLPREVALEYAAETVAGAAEMVLRSGRHPGALKDAVCSPGGSTIAGVHALEKNGLRAAAMDAVVAAFQKSKTMGK